ncbi:MAG: prepilin-type N-terminal cleavage/methylation domain-containing protein [Bacteroidota bacterium]
MIRIQENLKIECRAFSITEVMVAMALISIAFTGWIQLQARMNGSFALEKEALIHLILEAEAQRIIQEGPYRNQAYDVDGLQLSVQFKRNREVSGTQLLYMQAISGNQKVEGEYAELIWLP